MSEAMNHALSLVRNGTLRIDPDGSVWRLKAIIHGELRDITPRRVENVGGKGYFRVNLWKDGRLVIVMAHRLVYTWFVGPIPDDLQINHKDLNKQNNRPDNLEIVTGAENMQHSYANGRPLPWSHIQARTTTPRPGRIRAEPLAPDEWRKGKKLKTPQEIETAKSLRASGSSLKEIARQLDISVSHAHRLTSCGNGGGR